MHNTFANVTYMYIYLATTNQFKYLQPSATKSEKSCSVIIIIIIIIIIVLLLQMFYFYMSLYFLAKY